MSETETEKDINIQGENIVDDIVLGNLSKSKDAIADILKGKIASEIEDHRKVVASSMFSADKEEQE
tara:strand:- start:3102 stop:3299 length:198 start_codon:yes stop_codon:yes gene_type:complete